MAIPRNRILALNEIHRISMFPYVRNGYFNTSSPGSGTILQMNRVEMAATRKLMLDLVTNHGWMIAGDKVCISSLQTDEEFDKRTHIEIVPPQ